MASAGSVESIRVLSGVGVIRNVLTRGALRMRVKIKLPWPPRECSPNARVHWSKKSKAARANRDSCFKIAAFEHKLKALIPENYVGKFHLFIDFFPPDRRRRDDDNLLSMFKSSRDGLADAMGVDDKQFISHPFIKDDIGGYVMVTITDSPE